MIIYIDARDRNQKYPGNLIYATKTAIADRIRKPKRNQSEKFLLFLKMAILCSLIIFFTAL